ncbi:HEPN domain-containing protein [Mucilaginibacter glaciei]|uniref:HEPN domain-containing protein n=1 Tax=Mucilaginibacter glaciei TaxID=2772109 RepID=A0A926NNF4_9SPHI|nr:HEPN domain-containing protein [Mucilaginibacter glaciei]MBD1395309.1 HEPN domain-containing protein [Mucilaginibacter glaciei]
MVMESNKNYDSAPLNLKPTEIANPILVIADFFDVDSLPGHLERLQIWRKCILEDQYFKGDKGSPSELLHFYKLNLCLLEATYLLMDQNGMTAASADLYLIFKQVFDDYNLSTYRAILYQWLEFGLSVSAANEFIDTIDLIRVYENLQKLYHEAWHIYQHSASVSSLQIKDLVEKGEGNLIDNNGVKLYNLNTAIEIHRQETMSSLVAKIKHKVSSAQAIIYLGQPPVTPGNIFLFVLIEDNDQRQLQCVASTIEESCLQIASVTALVHRPSRLNRSSGDNLFFSNALKCPIIYLSGELLLPSVTVSGHGVRENELVIWLRWMEQGKDFLKGAEYYLTIGANKAALFSLEQAAECFLIGIIRVVNGYTTHIHNLSTLLNISRMFTHDIADVFDLGNHESLQLFNVLKHAYINVRYKDSYEIDYQSTASLFPYIKQLLAVVEQIYQRHLMMNTL